MSRTTTILMIPLLACAVSENKADKDSGDEVTSDDTSPGLHDTGDTGDEPQDTGPHGNDDTGVDTGVAPGSDTGEPPVEAFIPNWPDGTDPFADAIVNFSPGPDAGYGADELPDVVLGSPNGGGGGAGWRLWRRSRALASALHGRLPLHDRRCTDDWTPPFEQPSNFKQLLPDALLCEL